MNNALNTIVNEINERTTGGFSVGYIGNVGRGYDDRSWMVFAPHPGRVGTRDDTWGDFRSQEALIIAANRRYESLVRWAQNHEAA